MNERSDSFPVLWNAGEVEKLVDLYAKDAVFMPPGSPALSGRKRE